MSPSGVQRPATAEPEFVAYFQELFESLQLGLAGDTARRKSEREVELGSVRPGARVASATPSAASAPTPAGPSAGRELVEEALIEEAGLSGFLGPWPPDQRGELLELARDVLSVLRVWGQATARRGIESDFSRQLLDRREVAVRFASARMYAAARRASIEESAIDAVAVPMARRMGEVLFGRSDAVFAAQRGSVDSSSQELRGPASGFGAVRGVAFGLKSDDLRIRAKALVEPETGSGDA